MHALRLNCNMFPISKTEKWEFTEAGIEVTAQEWIEPQSALEDYDAVLVVSAKIPAEVILRFKHCRVIARYGSGTDNIDIAEATRSGILVTNVPDFCLSEMADHTLALILALSRKLFVMDRWTRQGQWQARVQVPTYRIAGKTLGLVGFGRIAQAVARRAAAFDLQVLCFDPCLDPVAAERLGVHSTDFSGLLRHSDFVSVHVPLTPETRHLIGDRELGMMKPSAYIINTSRGGVIDERALVSALAEGRIAGAGIDVYETLPMFDPNPSQVDHPLFHLDNVILTPHSGGCSVESLDYMMSQGARQAIAVLRGEWPSNCVNAFVTPRFPLTTPAASRAVTC
ncbi:MAG: C-terminal binding protein [Bryobacteraceae bacterium]